MFKTINTVTGTVRRGISIVDTYAAIGEKYANMHSVMTDLDIELQTQTRRAELSTKLAEFRLKQAAKKQTPLKTPA